VQGWAVVDNTVGADWDDVQLSLVAGAPQSFIQPLSQPLYMRRPEIPISTVAETTPQTHEAAEMAAPPPPMANNQLNAQKRDRAKSFGVAGAEADALSVQTNSNSVNTLISQQQVSEIATNNRNFAALAAIGAGVSGGSGVGGGVYRPSDAIEEGDVSTNAFDDFFEYALKQPVTIHKNESAMVPILQQDLPAEHVTLWSEKEATPLRAVWLENKSQLTLDSGSFSIFESGEFAGEGLLDPIHPGEKRLLSYAADQAVRVKVTARDSKRTLHHVQIRKGSIVETHMEVATVTYSATNSADVERTVLLEHPRRTNGWSLDEGLKPAEASPNLYRFRLAVPAHSTAKLEVRERGPEYYRVTLNANQNQVSYLLDLRSRVPSTLDSIQPVIDAQIKLTDLDARIADSKKAEETAAADEARDRENLTALKGNDAAKRFVDELNHAEDQLQSTRKQTADLDLQKQAAEQKLNELISGLSFDWDEKPAVP